MNAPYQELYDAQQRFFHSGATRSVAFRKKQLSRLEEVLRAHEGIIEEAMMADLRKHPQEVYTTELGGIYEEIRLLKKSIRQWMRPMKVSHPLYLLPGKSTIFPEPLGNVLVISPWNYPFLLSFRVAVGAIAAGNTVLLKPSELAARSAEVIEKIVNEHFPSEYFHVINGEGATVIPALLLHHHFDHVFFTGSTQVGSKIMEMAAKHLSPVSLELGGKSPCIVTDDANIPVAAKRIVWGKMVCSGQTCVAPDYLIVHTSVKDKMIAALIRQFETAYGVEPRHSESLGRIINRKRFDTLAAYLKEGRIIYGGTTDAEDLFISPTLMDNISPDAKIMQEEIFGPILPIFTYDDPEEALQLISKNPYPLALYVFATKPSKQQFFIDNVRFGGGGINETVVHLGNSELPFGGISYSGHGAYLGKHSFDTFSHFKSILERSTWFEPSLRHAPFSSFKTNWWRKLLGRR